MKSKSQNGFVIELMIIFMLVTFGFCMVITTYISSLTVERKSAKSEIKTQTVLNQLGEYYMRSVEAGGVFPDKSDSIANNMDITTKANKKFAWLDDDGNGKLDNSDETVKFFKTYNGYKFTDKISASYGGFIEFYETKSVYRRLTVKSGDEIKMILTVREIYVDKNTSDCEIETWYIGDGLTAEDESSFKETDLNILQLLWKFFGKLSGKLEDANLFSSGDFRDIFTFFQITYDVWQDVIIKGISGGIVT